MGARFVRSMRFSREEEDIERLAVLISNMSKDLFVTPASMTMRIQTRLARVSPNGTATQTKRPAPMVLILLCLLSIEEALTRVLIPYEYQSKRWRWKEDVVLLRRWNE